MRGEGLTPPEPNYHCRHAAGKSNLVAEETEAGVGLEPKHVSSATVLVFCACADGAGQIPMLT